MEITARDKKILYVLGLLLIAALFYSIGIRPLNQKIKKLDKQVQEAEELHDTIQMKLFQLDTLESFRETTEEKVKELSKRYYSMMLPAQTGRLITDRALGYGLRVNHFFMDASDDPVNLLAYVYSDAYKTRQEAIREAARQEAPTDEENTMVDVAELASIHADYGLYEVDDTTSSEVYATTMELDVEGDRGEEQALLDELIRNESMRVLSYKWSDAISLPYRYENGELVAIGGENIKRLLIRFELYMYDGSVYAQTSGE